jgi:hypothetical protein
MDVEEWNEKTKIVLAWADHQETSDVLEAIILSITLGDECSSDDLRSTYWVPVRSLGGQYEGFPFISYEVERLAKKRDGGLREHFEAQLSGVADCKVRGRVIYRNGTPSLEELTVTCTLCDNEKGRQKETKIRAICSEYNIKKDNLEINFRDCSPQHPSSKWHRSVGYQGRGYREF